MERILKIFIGFLSLWSSFVFAEGTHEYVLSNGLKLVVKEDHRAPLVVSEIWYKVGSSYEPHGITGISHALEHMMFRGTHRYGPGQLNKMIAEKGGKQNAFTDYDFTAYYQLLAANQLATSFKLEADRMLNLLLDPAAFSKEMQVVMEERRMRVDDNPQQTLLERLMASAFVSTTYHHPVIGWMHDLKQMTVHDLRHWYHQWYAPNNAVLVVVGDVQPDQVYHLALNYFGHLKPSVLPVLKSEQEIKPLGEKQLNIHVPAQWPCLMLAYNVPVIKDDIKSEDPYVLSLISTLLSEGDSARLQRHLVRGQQIAASIGVDYSPFSRLNNVILFYAAPAHAHTLAELKTALLTQIEALQRTNVTTAELERAKTKMLASKIYREDSIEQQATAIGSLEAVGLSWRYDQNYMQHINAITPEQIQKVAKRYLVPERLTVAFLDPLPASKRSIAPRSKYVR